jgi:hypothetical protein
MFDVRENLRFNQTFDCAEGFEDLGRQGRSCNIADHALVSLDGRGSSHKGDIYRSSGYV